MIDCAPVPDSVLSASQRRTARASAPWSPLLRLLVAALLLGLPVGQALPAGFTWDGRLSIPLGLQLNAQSVLRLPERLNGYIVEDPALVAVLTIDQRTLSLSPRLAIVDVRVILRGESGNLYVVRASTALPFHSILEVDLRSHSTDQQQSDAARNATPDTAEVLTRVQPLSHTGSATAALPDNPPAPTPNPMALMLRLMQGQPPTGFRVAQSSRTLLDSPELRIQAEQVWMSPQITGIVAVLTHPAQPGAHYDLDPERIEIMIPDFGLLRIFAANRYRFDDLTSSTRAYLVFMKPEVAAW